MTGEPLPPLILRLQKRRKRYRKMTFFSLLAVTTLAITPAMFSHALAFALYGIAWFGLLAVVGNYLHERTRAHLIALGY